MNVLNMTTGKRIHDFKRMLNTVKGCLIMETPMEFATKC